MNWDDCTRYGLRKYERPHANKDRKSLRMPCLCMCAAQEPSFGSGPGLAAPFGHTVWCALHLRKLPENEPVRLLYDTNPLENSSFSYCLKTSMRLLSCRRSNLRSVWLACNGRKRNGDVLRPQHEHQHCSDDDDDETHHHYHRHRHNDKNNHPQTTTATTTTPNNRDDDDSKQPRRGRRLQTTATRTTTSTPISSTNTL